MTVLLLVEGSFGHAVADEMARHVAELDVRNLTAVCAPGSVSPHPVLGEGLSDVTHILTALWREYPDELDRLDEACLAGATPWSGVVLDGNTLRAGPVIRPGSACYRCFRKRIGQHSTSPQRDRVLERLYRRHPEVGVAGFTPSMVAMAAAFLRLHHDHQIAPGTVEWIDLLGGIHERSTTVAVHGCSRCAPPRTTGSRYTEHLVAQLERRHGS